MIELLLVTTVSPTTSTKEDDATSQSTCESEDHSGTGLRCKIWLDIPATSKRLWFASISSTSSKFCLVQLYTVLEHIFYLRRFSARGKAPISYVYVELAVIFKS